MIINVVLAALVMLLAVANLFYGSVNIPAEQVAQALIGADVERESWAYIVTESRLPQTVTALLCGASLAASGLILQTTFRNPLAGPSILGITNGASLGVAIVMLLFGGVMTMGGTDAEGLMLGGNMAITIGALIGSVGVIVLLLTISRMVSGTMMLLIVGIMISFLTSSAVTLLNFAANADNIQGYVGWSMGSFSSVDIDNLPWFAGISLMGLLMALLMTKPLNALLLGDGYAYNLGVNIKRTRTLLLLITGILTAVSTAYCGPVAFIGLAVPHMARLATNTSNHMVLLPATILGGAAIALVCNLICVMPENTIIPINAVTPLFGVPVILYVVMRRTL